MVTWTVENETYQNMIDALEFHFDGLERKNYPVPEAIVTINKWCFDISLPRLDGEKFLVASFA